MIILYNFIKVINDKDMKNNSDITVWPFVVAIVVVIYVAVDDALSKESASDHRKTLKTHIKYSITA